MKRAAFLLWLIATPALAQSSPVLDAIRARDWGTARLLAGSPLGVKLVDFLRLLTPGQASAGEIVAFLRGAGDWPDRAALEQRYGEALRAEGDETEVAGLCAAHRPQAAEALARCAEAFALTGGAAQADAAARAAWITGITVPADESAFLARWGQAVGPEDQVARFAHLIGHADAAATRQLARLPEDQRHLGEARLALRRLAANAGGMVDAVPADLRADPALLLDEARYDRRTQDEDAALALWRGPLRAAEAGAPPAERRAFWTERDALARALMGMGRAADAYAIARDGLPPDAAAVRDGAGQAPAGKGAVAPGTVPAGKGAVAQGTLPAEQSQESAFLAGWIALEGLHDRAAAKAQFAALAGMAHSAISQARAYYWLGRAEDAPDAARQEYRRAAAWPLTYYGQKAALAAGEDAASLRARIAAMRDPVLPPGSAARTQALELFKAAQLLIGWEDTRRAADFFLQLLQTPADAAQRQVVAEAALAENMPEIAVMAARLIGKDGGALPQSGWPRPVEPVESTVPADLLLAVMRQESGFDARVVSPAGAIGLMQLMPGTARDMARALPHGKEAGLTQGALVPASWLSAPAVNMRLGSLYLASLLGRFDGEEVAAIAAYNAGPHRVREWLDGTLPAPVGDAATIDWIESIPIAETRNYVQRVLENQTVYAAKAGG